MNIFLVPLENIPKDFVITVGDRDLNVICKWNDSLDAGWMIDIRDDISNTNIICGIPLVTGVDLLEQYEYLGLGVGLVVYTNGNANAIPTLDNLGVDSNLYLVSP